MTREEAIKQLKSYDAMGIIPAIQMAINALEQPEPCEDADKLKRCRFEYINACKTVTFPTPDTSKDDIHDAYAVLRALHPIFGDEDFKKQREKREDDVPRNGL